MNVEHIPLIMGLFSFIGGAVAWYGAAVKKSYASERDFQHLLRKYESLAQNVASLSDMLDDRMDALTLIMNKIETRQDIILSQTRDTNGK